MVHLVQMMIIFWDFTPRSEFDLFRFRQWRTEGRGGCSNPPEIPKALQNRAKLNPIVKTVKNC